MYTLHIPSMTCGGCARHVTGAVKALDAQAQVAVDLQSRIVRIASQQDADAIVRALDEAGYPAEQAA